MKPILFMFVLTAGLMASTGFAQWKLWPSTGFYQSRNNLSAENTVYTTVQPLAEFTKVMLESEGVQRQFFVYRPRQAETNKSLPAFFALHGGQGSAAGMEQAANFKTHADKFNFIAVLPESNSEQWNDGRLSTENSVSDVIYLEAVAQQLVTDWGADKDRLYAAGISSGGFMAQKLACSSTSSFAGYGVVAANMIGHLEAQCDLLLPKPMVFFYGTDDPLMTFSGEQSSSPVAQMAKGYGTETRLSSPETIEYWAVASQCKDLTGQILEDVDPTDGTRVFLLEFSGCVASQRAFIIVGGGHNWPGGTGWAPVWRQNLTGKKSQDISATVELIKFFGLDQ